MDASERVNLHNYTPHASACEQAHQRGSYL